MGTVTDVYNTGVQGRSLMVIALGGGGGHWGAGEVTGVWGRSLMIITLGGGGGHCDLGEVTGV